MSLGDCLGGLAAGWVARTLSPRHNLAARGRMESSTRSESKMLSLQSFLQKGVSLGYVGSILSRKDLKDLRVSGLPPTIPSTRASALES